MIRGIQDETNTKIDIEDDGTVFIASSDGPSADRARDMILALIEEPEMGRIYTGRVVRVEDYGAFVEFLPGQDGLVHLDQLADHPVMRTEDEVQIGDEIMVMVTDIDARRQDPAQSPGRARRLDARRGARRRLADWQRRRWKPRRRSRSRWWSRR